MSFFWIVLVPMLAVAFLLVVIASRKGGSAKRRQPSSTHDEHSHLLWLSTMNSPVPHHTDSSQAQDYQPEPPSHGSHLIMPENNVPDCGSSTFDARSSSFDSGGGSFDSGSSGGGSSGCD